MEFLYPRFLYAFLLLLIPVIIHLFNFRKFKKHYFSNVAALREIHIQTRKYQNLKHLLVLATRLLFMSFLILAFAQPYIPEQNQKIYSRKIASIYIDNSPSMQGKQGEISLLELSKNYAYKILETLDDDEKIQILTNDFSGFQQRFFSKEKAQQIIEKITYSNKLRTIVSIANRIKEATKKFPSAKKKIFLISDFQQINFTENFRPDTAFQWHLIPVQSAYKQNVSIDSVWFSSPVRKTLQPEKIRVRIKNHSNEDFSSIPLRLIINRKTKSLASVQLPAHSSADSSLTFTVQHPGWKQAKAYIEDYPYTFDDTLYFSWQVKNKHKILLISDANLHPFFQKLYAEDSSIVFSAFTFDNIDYMQVPQFDAVILGNVKQINKGLRQALEHLLDAGKNLIIFPSHEADKNMLNEWLTSLSLPKLVKKDTSQILMAEVNRELDFFNDIFDDIPENMNYPVVKNYWKINKQGTYDWLIRFKNHYPAIIAKESKNGRVFLHAFGLGNKYGNYLQHALFVPLSYKASIDLKNHYPLYLTTSSQTTVKLPFLGKDEVYKIKVGQTEIIPAQHSAVNTTYLSLENTDLTQGTFPVLHKDSVVAYLSINYPSEESNVKTYSVETLKEIFGDQTSIYTQNLKTISKEIIRQQEAKIYWRELLIAALIFLLLEIILLRFLK